MGVKIGRARDGCRIEFQTSQLGAGLEMGEGSNVLDGVGGEVQVTQLGEEGALDGILQIVVGCYQGSQIWECSGSIESLETASDHGEGAK